MITQENIGWSHIFAGHILQKWIKLYEESACSTTQNNQQRNLYLWGASVVDVILSEFIRLWKLRNTEVHGKTTEKNEVLRKKKLTIETKRLNPMRNKARPGDQFLFYDNIDEFIEKSFVKRIGSWVCSHHNVIKNSVNKWKESSLCGTKSIVDWIWNVNSAETIDKLH